MQQPQRQQIRDQLGILEEKLEDLGAFASTNERMGLKAPAPMQFGSDLLLQDALDSMRVLSHLVHEQQLFKSVSTGDFLHKILSLLVQDAAAQGCDIAVSHYGEGKISMEMAELVMGAIVAGFRATLRSHKALPRAERARNQLFATGSIYVEVRSSPGEIMFRIVDDGKGFGDSSDISIGAEKQFDKLREHIARCGGWFGRKSFGGVGGAIEFKVPLAHNRVEALVLKSGNFEALLPSSCVAEIFESGAESKPPKGALILGLSEAHGLEPNSAEGGTLLRVCVADLEFWLACEELGSKNLVRRISAAEFVEEGSWLQLLGLFQGRSLPLFDGTTLIRFFKENSGGSS